MLTLQQAKKLIGKTDLSDEEILKIRDDFRFLAEAIFESWQSERTCEQNKKDILSIKNKKNE